MAVLWEQWWLQRLQEELQLEQDLQLDPMGLWKEDSWENLEPVEPCLKIDDDNDDDDQGDSYFVFKLFYK